MSQQAVPSQPSTSQHRTDSTTWCVASDAEVIDAVLGGEVDRYAELVTRYQLAAWKLAYSFVGNMEDAKELSQNGFVKAYQHLAHFRRHAKFSTWLYRILVNECKDFFKRRVRQPQTVPLAADDPEDPVLFEVEDSTGDPRDALATQELAKHLGEAIRSLPRNQQQAFVLHHLHGRSLEEVADVLGCRVGTVKAHLFRACSRLRVRLAPYVSVPARPSYRGAGGEAEKR